MGYKQLEILYLSQSDIVATNLTMKKTIEIVEKVFKAYSRGEVQVPFKMDMTLEAVGEPGIGGTSQPAYIYSDEWKIAGIKWIGFNWKNPFENNFPTHLAMIILNDTTTFAPIAVLEGSWITAMRTGAATAVGVKYLARKDAEVVGIVGAGFQSRFQLRAVNEVLNVGKAYITDVRMELAEVFEKEMREEVDFPIIPSNSVETLAKESDVIITATSANKPLVKYRWLKNGALVCAIGTFQELDLRIVKLAKKFVVDHLKQAMNYGQSSTWFRRGYITERYVYAEIGDIIDGMIQGRENENELILYTPSGVSSLDVATGYVVYQMAKQKGIGTYLKYI